jgi:proteic killer suppression protein
MNLNYRDKRTKRFVQGAFIRAFQGFEQQAERRPAILNAAPSLGTLLDLSSNRREALRGDWAGQFSIRINQQWPVCFEWPDGQAGPSDVEIVDNH